MTNREKYAKEILDIVCAGNIVAVKNGVLCKCDEITCRECDFGNLDACRNNRVKWFNSEYIEPSVDWSKVPVDTPILVRDSIEAEWVKRYFSSYAFGRVWAFSDGGTSWSSDDSERCWRYAKIPEDNELRTDSILRADGRKEK